MDAILVVVNIFLILVAIVVICVILLQQGNTANLGAISGGAETFFGKNKAKSYEGKLALITKIGTAVFIVLAITATALNARIANTSAQSNTTPDSAVEDTVQDADATPAPETEATPAPTTEATPAPVETSEAESTPAPVESPEAQSSPAAG